MKPNDQTYSATPRTIRVIRPNDEFQEAATTKVFLAVQIDGKSYADRISAR